MHAREAAAAFNPTNKEQRQKIKKMKTPLCHTSRESMGYKTPQTTLTLTLWPWPTTFDHDLYDLDFDPCDLDLGPSILKLGWNFYIFDLDDLDLWPWPSNSSEIWWSLMCAPTFRSVGPTVQPAERKQTHRHTHGHYRKYYPFRLRAR